MGMASVIHKAHSVFKIHFNTVLMIFFRFSFHVHFNALVFDHVLEMFSRVYQLLP